ncbi:MAG: hypothetical protein ACOX7C_06985 [Brevefilum sp.]|jgi:hypothetical protein
MSRPDIPPRMTRLVIIFYYIHYLQKGKNMTITLASLHEQLETRLSDSTNLVFSKDFLDEAIRAALGDLSNTYGSSVQIKNLDGATDSTIEEADLQTFLMGAMAYALRFRLYERIEEATPVREAPDALAQLATETMNEFQALLTHVRLRRFYASIDPPYSQWTWDESCDM